ncbi:hypothetical protein HDC29_002217 [Sphingopyxis sp. JAI108]|nr:hypothetical protein [Sphingopyxis sp. JAI108]
MITDKGTQDEEAMLDRDRHSFPLGWLQCAGRIDAASR